MINLIFNKTVEIINCMNILKSNKSFQIVNINLFSKPEWYIKLNPPSGATPCIQLDDGRTIPESLICSEYLDKAYSGEKLTPTDAYTNSQHKLILEYFNTKVIFNFYNAIKGENESSVNDFIKCLEELESKLPDNERFFGGLKHCFFTFLRLCDYDQKKLNFFTFHKKLIKANGQHLLIT